MPEGIQYWEESARTELRAVAEELRRIEERLKAVHRNLPESAEPEDEDRTDVATEIRAAIECVLTDNLAPAERSLEAASIFQEKRPE